MIFLYFKCQINQIKLKLYFQNEWEDKWKEKQIDDKVEFKIFYMHYMAVENYNIWIKECTV